LNHARIPAFSPAFCPEDLLDALIGICRYSTPGGIAGGDHVVWITAKALGTVSRAFGFFDAVFFCLGSAPHCAPRPADGVSQERRRQPLDLNEDASRKDAMETKGIGSRFGWDLWRDGMPRYH
jgi:hypothetical protein